MPSRQTVVAVSAITFAVLWSLYQRKMAHATDGISASTHVHRGTGPTQSALCGTGST